MTGALNYRANKANDHEILALLKKYIYEKNARRFNEIGWVEIAAQLTVEFLIQNIMFVYSWELLQQRLSNAKIPWII